VAHTRGILDRLVRVGGFLLGGPLSGGGGRVVEVFELDREVAGLPARLLESHRDAVDDGVGLVLGGAGAGEAGDDLDDVGVLGGGEGGGKQEERRGEAKES